MVEKPLGNEIRAVIVDDHILFAQAVRATLEARGMEVVAEVRSGAGAQPWKRWHLTAPTWSSSISACRIRAVWRWAASSCKIWPETKVIAVTLLEDTKLAQEAIRVGFQGYVTKNVDMHQFISAVRSVLAGECGHASAARGPPWALRTGRADRGADFGRELEVLALLARGFSSHRIAAELGLAPNTVRTHVQNILTKLQVHSRLEAAAFAVRHGLADSSGPELRATP